MPERILEPLLLLAWDAGARAEFVSHPGPATDTRLNLLGAAILATLAESTRIIEPEALQRLDRDILPRLIGKVRQDPWGKAELPHSMAEALEHSLAVAYVEHPGRLPDCVARAVELGMFAREFGGISSPLRHQVRTTVVKDLLSRRRVLDLVVQKEAWSYIKNVLKPDFCPNVNYDQLTAAVSTAARKLISKSGWEDRVDDPLAYLAGVMRNRVADGHRGAQALKRGGGLVQMPLNANVPGQIDHGCDEQRSAIVRAWWEQLSQSLRQFILVHWVNGVTVHNAADQVGLPARTLESQARSAKTELERRLRSASETRERPTS